MIAARLIVLVAFLAAASDSLAQAVKDREGAVRDDRAAMENDSRWDYNDLDHGFDQARRTGKPLLVVLRCVPCLACSGIDAQVLLHDNDLTPLLDQFVCVRVINANALDLALFQFDFDLSFSAIMFNGDGSIYGRYGSWTHQKNAQDKTTTGFKHALEAALGLHRGYPANKASLAGKQGAPAAFKNPVDIPTLNGKYRLELDWNGKVVPSCVHCHQIGDALRLNYRNNKEPIPDNLIYPMPPPETLGMTLAQDEIARVEAVAPGSAADKCGMKVGDKITSMAGQPPISIADVSWALHRAPESGSLPITVKRGSEEKSLTLTLAEGWRSKSDISRRVGTWGMRGMATGGLSLEDLPDGDRTQRGIDKSKLALLVKRVGTFGKHAAARDAGFLQNDIIIAIDGATARIGEGELIGKLLKHQPGESVSAIVLRGTDRVNLTLPIQ